MDVLTTFLDFGDGHVERLASILKECGLNEMTCAEELLASLTSTADGLVAGPVGFLILFVAVVGCNWLFLLIQTLYTSWTPQGGWRLTGRARLLIR